jgi:hypothetical protein
MSSSIEDARSMKIWRTTGSAAMADGPIVELSTGTVRHPMTRWPSSLTTFSMIASQSLRPFSSLGRKSMPTP